MKENDLLFQVSDISRVLLLTAFSMVTKENCLNYIKHSGYIIVMIKFNNKSFD